MLQKFLIKIFGINYVTSFYGTIFVLSAVGTYLTSKPEVIAFLPDFVEHWINIVCGCATALTGILTFLNTKDKQVTKTNGSALRQDDGSLKSKEQLEDSDTVKSRNQL